MIDPTTLPPHLRPRDPNAPPPTCRATLSPDPVGRCVLAEGHTGDDHLAIASDVDDRGQVMLLVRWPTIDPTESRSLMELRGDAHGNVEVKVADGPFGSPWSRTTLDAKATGALMRYLGWKFPAFSLAGVMAQNERLIEERRVSALPNETLLAAVNEARATYSAIAARIMALGTERLTLTRPGTPERAAVDRAVSELEALSASLKATLDPLARPQSPRK